MVRVPTYEAVLYFAAVLSMCVVLVVVLAQLRDVRRAINETNGLYRVMVGYVREQLREEDNDDYDGPSS